MKLLLLPPPPGRAYAAKPPLLPALTLLALLALLCDTALLLGSPLSACRSRHACRAASYAARLPASDSTALAPVISTNTVSLAAWAAGLGALSGW